jgi:hypothetical protein
MKRIIAVIGLAVASAVVLSGCAPLISDYNDDMNAWGIPLPPHENKLLTDQGRTEQHHALTLYRDRPGSTDVADSKAWGREITSAGFTKKVYVDTPTEYDAYFTHDSYSVQIMSSKVATKYIIAPYS